MDIFPQIIYTSNGNFSAGNGGDYTLPTASNIIKGGIKVGFDFNVLDDTLNLNDFLSWKTLDNPKILSGGSILDDNDVPHVTFDSDNLSTTKKLDITIPVAADIEGFRITQNDTAKNTKISDIAVAADFPTVAVANANIGLGYYYISSAVTDNNPAKTNTGQSFSAGNKIAWTGSAWIDQYPPRAMTIVSYSDHYALKIDHMSTGNHDTVNINNNSTGASTTLGIGASNTTLSVVKVTNDAAQTGGVIFAGIGSNPSRTTAIFSGEQHGTGAGYQIDMQGNGPSFKTDSYATSASLIDFVARNTSGDIVSVDSTTNHASGAFVMLSNSHASSAVKGLQIELAGSGVFCEFLKSGVLQFGVSNSGGIRGKRYVITKNTDYTITAGDTGTLFRNNAAAGLTTMTLPAGASGLRYGFYVYDADGFRIKGNGAERIRIAGVQSTATTGYVESLTIGNVLWLVWSGVEWFAESVVQSTVWTVN